MERYFGNKTLNPFRSFLQAQDPFDRYFSDFFNANMKSIAEDRATAPSCDIADEGNNYLLKVDLPGVTKDQIKVEATKDQLSIHAELREEKKTDSKKKFLSEVYYGSYDRTFNLPGAIDDKKIEAKFENGVLTVTVPKTEALKGKLIPVH